METPQLIERMNDLAEEIENHIVERVAVAALQRAADRLQDAAHDLVAYAEVVQREIAGDVIDEVPA